jgi:predicted metalloprotease with PDZ domain
MQEDGAPVVSRTRFVSIWFVALGAAFGGCSALGTRAVVVDGRDADLVYEFTRGANGVTVTASSIAAAGDTDWQLPDSWAGNDTPDRDLGRMEAHDHDGRSLAIEQRALNVWRVHADRGGRQAVRYTLAPTEWAVSKEPTDHYRPIVTADLFHVLGARTLVVPAKLDPDRELRVRFAFEGFDASGWNVATSFGSGERDFTVRARVSEVQHAVYLAGAFALESRDVRGRPVSIAVQGTRWPTPVGEFADLAARIVEYERGFFEDWDYPNYLISVIEAGPADEGSRSIGGTGLHDSFAMFVSPGTPLVETQVGQKQVLHVLAHEMFHHWCRSEERRVGKECRRLCRSRWSPYH